MQEVSFEDALEIITLKDPRYPREAYLFVREALDHTQRLLVKEKHCGIRHVSGQELLGGIKDYAATQFGPMAMMVLQEWGIHSCQDFGELVFNMVETGGCPTLCIDDVNESQAFIALLHRHDDPLSRFIWEQFSEPARQQLTNQCDDASKQKELLVRELNQLISSGPIYLEERFAGVSLSPDIKCLVQQDLKGVPLSQFNRLLLQSAYPQHIAKSHGLLAKTKEDSRADFEEGYDFFDAFRKPFLPPSKQAPARRDAAASPR